MITTDPRNIDAILDRGVIAHFFPTKEDLRARLLSGERLRFYMGFDPTAKSLHLGHAQGLLVLEDFRKLGHEVIFLIGSFTGMIGDPSAKSSARTTQTKEQVQENFAGWVDQVKNIVSFDDPQNPVLVKYNAEWLASLTFSDVLHLASHFTVQQMLERDMFDKRIKEGRPIYVHEFLYPLMQGFDSVAMDVDVELCGNDQIFNALAGRTLMQKMRNKEKLVIANHLIADEHTGLLMSKSNNTGVFLNLSPDDLFGAIMALSDGMLRPLLIGCTRLPLTEVERLLALENPRDAKIALAQELVRMFHGDAAAQRAQEYFIKTFSKKEIPDDVPQHACTVGTALVDYLVASGAAASKGEARRKIRQGGVSINGKKVTDEKIVITAAQENHIIKVGKHFFVKIVISGV